jgi:hypothetical protein
MSGAEFAARGSLFGLETDSLAFDTFMVSLGWRVESASSRLFDLNGEAKTARTPGAPSHRGALKRSGPRQRGCMSHSQRPVRQ